MKCLRLLAAFVSFLIPTLAAAPISLHPENSRYFLFRGNPTILLTSGEHYGAVLNLDFDYNIYLAELEARQLNNTRAFTGVYLEPPGAFNIVENTLAPANGRYIGPWPRTGVPGARHGGNKFDLNKWNDAYFARLRDFVRAAGRRGVVVELNLFCPFYEEMQWNLSPLNPINNVNNLGSVARTNVYTMDKHGGLLPVQEALVRKIVLELNQFDNLYYEICNEPYFGGVTLDWQKHIANVITEAERNLPNKHLISQNIANGAATAANVHPNVSIYNFHYAAPPDAIALNWQAKKPIGDNETGFRGTNDLAYRREAWEFILAGGALFNNLDYSFTVRHPAGTFVNYPATQPGGGNPRYREQLRTLRNFIYKFDFLRMTPDTNFIKNATLPLGGTIRALANTNEAYAIYLGPAAPPSTADKYSVRWTGKFRVPKTGSYNFFTQSNDGVRLAVDNSTIIDNWTDHSQTEDHGTINLQAGKVYNLKLEYYNAGGNAVIRLAWQPPGLQRTLMTGFVSSTRAAGLDAEFHRGANFDSLAFKRIDPNINFDWSAKSPLDASSVLFAPQTARLELDLMRGDYTARWLNPRTGAIERTQRFEHRRGLRRLESPPYTEDIALELRRARPTTGKRLPEQTR